MARYIGSSPSPPFRWGVGVTGTGLECAPLPVDVRRDEPRPAVDVGLDQSSTDLPTDSLAGLGVDGITDDVTHRQFVGFPAGGSVTVRVGLCPGEGRADEGGNLLGEFDRSRPQIRSVPEDRQRPLPSEREVQIGAVDHAVRSVGPIQNRLRSTERAAGETPVQVEGRPRREQLPRPLRRSDPFEVTGRVVEPPDTRHVGAQHPLDCGQSRLRNPCRVLGLEEITAEFGHPLDRDWPGRPPVRWRPSRVAGTEHLLLEPQRDVPGAVELRRLAGGREPYLFTTAILQRERYSRAGRVGRSVADTVQQLVVAESVYALAVQRFGVESERPLQYAIAEDDRPRRIDCEDTVGRVGDDRSEESVVPRESS